MRLIVAAYPSFSYTLVINLSTIGEHIMAYWLLKSEPDAFAIDDLQHLQQGVWDGVRNYQARNFMREMQPGDSFLFYHSSCQPPGLAGVGRITSSPYPDRTALDPNNPYHDARASEDRLPWVAVDVAFEEKFPRLFSLDQLRELAGLEDLALLRRGNRLSVMPVKPDQWQIMLAAARG